MKQNTLSIHSENILPIIKKWLYSDKDIFIRELVSNASDALNKVKILRDTAQVKAADADFKISVVIDKAKKTISIIDTGIGMTEEEVVKYIAQIAFSGAEEFVKKFQSQTTKDPIIGHFGLGFYSAYMVASKVELDTLSYKPGAKPVFWSCDGSAAYSVGLGKRTSRGTTIVLHVSEEGMEYLEEAKLKELLTRYCRFFPFPIDCNGKSIENRSPLWLKNSSECTDQDYLEFYRSFFPLDPDPMFWIHLNVDYPFHLQGILYFPKLHRRMDPKESSIQLFCNRVFVSENCKEILPDFLSMLRGAIDSPDIPLNVSRSSLQMDKNVRQLTAHISKKISDRLSSLYRSDRQKYITCWPEIEAIVKLGAMQDEKFYDRMKEAIIWKNSRGEWTVLSEYIERNPGQKIFYAMGERGGPLLQAYQEKKIEFLYAQSWIDTPLLSFLEGKLSCKFQRIDGAPDEKLLDPSREKNVVDQQGKTEASRLSDFIRKSLNQKEIQVEAKSLSSDNLPALLVLDEEQRRFRDYMAITQGGPLPAIKKGTFIVNTNNKLVQAIRKLELKAPEVATELARHLFDLARLSQKELEPAEFDEVLARHTAILEKLASLIR